MTLLLKDRLKKIMPHFGYAGMKNLCLLVNHARPEAIMTSRNKKTIDTLQQNITGWLKTILTTLTAAPPVKVQSRPVGYAEQDGMLVLHTSQKSRKWQSIFDGDKVEIWLNLDKNETHGHHGMSPTIEKDFNAIAREQELQSRFNPVPLDVVLHQSRTDTDSPCLVIKGKVKKLTAGEAFKGASFEDLEKKYLAQHPGAEKYHNAGNGILVIEPETADLFAQGVTLVF